MPVTGVIREAPFQMAFYMLLLLTLPAVKSESNCAPFTFPNLRHPESEAGIVKEADLNLGALLPLHGYSKTAPCGEGVVVREIADAEAMVYAIERINNDTHLLPNISLGYVILDECYKATTAVSRAAHFIPVSTNEKSPQCSNKDTSFPFYDVVGVVGCLYSSISLAVATFLAGIRIPQISPISMTDELSNKELYPYFMRIVPPNRNQARTIIDIIERFNWTYISTVNSEGSYGGTGIKHVKTLARKRGICIAYSAEVNKLTSNDQYKSVVQNLRMNGQAKVVVLFVHKNEGKGLLRAARELGAEKEFIWIISNGFSTSLTGIESVALNSFMLELASGPATEFAHYLTKLTPDRNHHNPWYRDFWAAHFQCTWANETGKPNCREFTELPYELGVGGFRPRMIDCVYTFAYGLHSLIEKKCPEAFTNKTLLQHCISGAELLKELKNVTFKGLSGQIQYDSYGDMKGIFDIHHQRIVNERYEVLKVGTWDKLTESLNIDMGQIQWNLNSSSESGLMPESVCSKPCKKGEFYIQQELLCCWQCRRCRNNEVTVSNATSCEECPPLTWPDSTVTTCLAIPPTYMRWNEGITLMLTTLAIVGIIASGYVTAIYVKFRNVKLIKASSKELSYVILCGIISAYLTVFSFVARPSRALCTLSHFGFNLSFAVLYAALLAKVSRISRIFESAKKSKSRPPFISTRAQLTIAAILVTFQVSGQCVSVCVCTCIYELLDLTPKTKMKAIT